MLLLQRQFQSSSEVEDMPGVLHDHMPTSRPGYRSRRLIISLLPIAGAAFGSVILATFPSQMLSPVTRAKMKPKAPTNVVALGLNAEESCDHLSCIRRRQVEGFPYTFPTTKAAESSGSTNAYYYRNRSQMTYEFNSTVQFIFTVGLEGTGHHLMGSITSESPAVERLNNFSIWNEHVGSLQHLLFAHPGDQTTLPMGIWNAHCVPEREASTLEDSIVDALNAIEGQANKMIVKNGQQRQDTFKSTATLTERTTLPLPLNTAYAKHRGRYGQVSYPNFRGKCRPLNYPDLNLLYNACRKAKVDCLQVYIYRHPLEVLNSISRRGFGNDDTSTMQMYITNLHVIANQLRLHASRTLGCFGFFSDDPKDLYWVDAQKDLWAWEDDTQHRLFMDSVYEKPKHDDSNMTNEEKMQEYLSHSAGRAFVQSWWNVHQHALQVCRQATLTKKATESTDRLPLNKNAKV